MRFLMALVVLAGAAYFLYNYYQQVASPAKLSSRKSHVNTVGVESFFEDDEKKPAPVVSTVTVKSTPDILLSAAEIGKIRANTINNDPAVRWSAMEFLYTMRDPAAVAIVQKAVSDDPNPEIRIKAIRLLKDQGDVITMQKFVGQLKDGDTEVRLAALKALGDLGHPAAVPYITECLKDYEPDVRTEALRTLGRIEDKRKNEFNIMAAKLRQDYEEAVKRSREEALKQ